MYRDDRVATQVCDTRLKVTFLRHDMNHASQQ